LTSFDIIYIFFSIFKTHIAGVCVFVDTHGSGRCDCVSILHYPPHRRSAVCTIPTLDGHENSKECAEFYQFVKLRNFTNHIDMMT
jgi:hypothetical protein